MFVLVRTWCACLNVSRFAAHRSQTNKYKPLRSARTTKSRCKIFSKMDIRYIIVVIVSNVVFINAITHPLPDEQGKLMHELIKCPPGKEFQWEKTESVENDMKINYKCGGGNVEAKTLGCDKANYKASYKRDGICDPGPDPDFAIFREGKDPNVMDTARIIFYCMKVTKNSLPKCS